MSNKSRKIKANNREETRENNKLYGGVLTKEHLIKVLHEKNHNNTNPKFRFISTTLTGEHYSGVDDVDFENEIINLSYDNPNVDGDPDNGGYVLFTSFLFDKAVGEINCQKGCVKKFDGGFGMWCDKTDKFCSYHKDQFDKERYI